MNTACQGEHGGRADAVCDSLQYRALQGKAVPGKDSNQNKTHTAYAGASNQAFYIVLSTGQFAAIEIALITGFLPAFLLSGFLFEIKSMPQFIQIITQVLPAKHFVSSIQTVFLAGDVWPLLLRDMASMLIIGTVFFGITKLKSRKRLD